MDRAPSRRRTRSAAVEPLESRLLLTTGEVIVNGGFETTANWVRPSGSWQMGDLDHTNYHSGYGYAYYGVGGTPAQGGGGYVHDSNGSMYQQVTIPAGTLNPQLTFWTKITSQETTTTQANDTMTVQVLNSSGGVLSTLATYSNLDKGSSSGGPYTSTGKYTLRTFPMSAYVGQTVRISFAVSTDATLGTMFRVDDVSLAPPSPVVPGTSNQVVAYIPDYRYSLFSKMDLDQLTHINYFSVGFASTGALTQPSATFNSHLDTVVAAAHAKGVGVSITTGPGQPYATMGASAAARAKLADDLKAYVLAHNLDGVDIDWEPPAKGVDQHNYGLLIDDLYAAFNPIGKKITAAANPWTKEIPVDAVKKMNWVNVMCYDFDYANHSTYAASIDGMWQWHYYGVPKDKLVMGVPFYGRYGSSWSNTTSKTYGEAPAPPDEHKRIVENYKLVTGVDLPPTVDSYTDQFGNTAYFNGVRTMQLKQAFIRDQAFAGTMIWEIGHDHWDAASKYDKYSLLPVVGSMINPPAWLTTTVGSLHDLVNAQFYATLGTMTLNADTAAANPKLEVTINNGAAVVLGATNHIGALAVDAGGKMDVKDKILIVDGTSSSPIGAWNGSAYTGISGMPQSSAIISSLAGADMVIGVAEASSLMSFSSGTQTKTWQGQTIDGSSVLVRRTYNGDANLDGVIDADDYFAIDSHYGATGSAARWSYGDFDRNGRIDSDDYFVLDSVYSRHQAGLPASIVASAPMAGSSGGAELPTSATFSSDQSLEDERGDDDVLTSL